MKKIITVFIIIVVLSGIGAAVFFNYKNSKPHYNDSGAVGNTAGNLNNGGLFCEYKDKIYFANPKDFNHLYVMNSDCTNAKKLNDDSVAYINVYGNYIFYARNNNSTDTIGMVFKGLLYGVYRTDLNGGKPKKLYSHASGILSLSGNQLFYQQFDDSKGLSLYKVNIDGSGSTQISDKDLNPSSVYEGSIYTANVGKDHNIYTINTQTNSISTFCKANAYMVDMEGSYLYYIDLDNKYSLVRLNIESNQVETLADGKCIAFNRYGSKIFYQLEGDGKSGLYRMNTDGSQKEQVLSGDITNVHCTSQYTFFQYFNDQGTLYRIPTTGPIQGVEQISITSKKK